jgi:endoglucanase
VEKTDFCRQRLVFREVGMMKLQADMRCCGGRHVGILQTRFIKIFVCMILCSLTPLYAATPWLHTDANRIKDPVGNVVVLRGIALIDLGFLEEWEGGAIEMIDRLTDKNDSQGDSPGWYPKVIRIMIAPPDSTQEPWPHPFNPDNNDLYNLLRTVVNYCKSKDLYVIIDWHYVANTYDHVETTSEFWSYMAPRFANDSHVLFELFNEPINDVDDDWIFNANDVNDWLSVRGDMQAWIDIVRDYAPNNLILVAGAFYSQVIGPAASYPLTGDNIVIVSHIYPGHWLSGQSSSYKSQITTCAAVYPVFMTEWGFTLDPNYDDEWHTLIGAITNYGQPLADFREQYGIGYTAWVASDDWGPPMFVRQTDPPPAGTWSLRCGEGEMGCFTKDILYQKRNNDQPTPDFIDFANFAAQWGRTDCGLPNVWCNGADFYQDGSVLFDDLEAFVDDWLYPE